MPSTFIAKLLLVHRVAIVDHVDPPSVEASEVNVGAGETSEVTALVLQYQPMVDPELLLTTTKYLVFGSRFNGDVRVCESTPSP